MSLAAHRWARVALVLVVTTLGACFSRGLPARYPAASAASTAAEAAPPAPLTTALDSEPPLPGEPPGNWFGLQAPGERTRSVQREHGRKPSSLRPPHGGVPLVHEKRGGHDEHKH